MSLQQLMWSMLVFGIALTNVVRAQDEDEDEEDVVAAGVTLKTIFPEQPENVHLTAGQPTKALVNFENGADSTYQIDYIGAHLAHAHQADRIAQNLTGLFVNRTVNQGESVAMVYKFTPWKELDPRSYNLVLQVYFMSEDDNERITLSAFNQTVPMHDGTSSFDIQGLFLVIIVVSVVGFTVTNFKGKGKTMTARRTAAATATAPTPATSAETGTTSGNVDYSYVSTQHRQATRNRSQEGRSKSPKSKN